VIGTQALKNIALSFVIFDTLQVVRQGSFDLDLFWRRAITAAVAAETLAKRVGFPGKDIFVTALLQDFGVLVLFLSCGPVYTEVFDAKRVSGRELHVEETKRLGFTHAEVGYQILKSWNLPEAICEPILTHPAPRFADRNDPAVIINLADRIASIYHGKQATRKSIEAKELLNNQYGLSHEQAMELIDVIGGKAVQAVDIFSIPAGDMKPFSQIMQEANNELARLNYSYEQLVLELTQAKQNAERLAVELKKANDNLRNLALRDGLTGLYNHRYFQDILASELDKAQRYGHQLSILLIDIDFFKNINDEHGHQVGDLVLQEISRLLEKLVRRCDIVARYGGEEFAIVLPETGMSGARVLAQRLRRGVEQHQVCQAEATIAITVSIGVASTETIGPEVSRSLLFSQCDHSLYAAKRNGRNRVEAAFPEDAEADFALAGFQPFPAA